MHKMTMKRKGLNRAYAVVDRLRETGHYLKYMKFETCFKLLFKNRNIGGGFLDPPPDRIFL